MADKLIISFEEYTKIVEKLAIQIHNNYKPTVLIGIMRGAAPIIDILSRILKLPIAYIVIQSYSGEGMEDKQGNFNPSEIKFLWLFSLKTAFIMCPP